MAIEKQPKPDLGVWNQWLANQGGQLGHELLRLNEGIPANVLHAADAHQRARKFELVVSLRRLEQGAQS